MNLARLASQWMTVDGRLGRTGYWIVTALLTALLLLASRFEGRELCTLPLLPLLMALALFGWIDVASGIKRLHDRGKSGWWLLLVLVPWVGPLRALIELGCLPGDPQDNDYGPAPGDTAQTSARRPAVPRRADALRRPVRAPGSAAAPGRP